MENYILNLYALNGPTDLTWEEQNITHGDILFKGEYLKTLEKNWKKFVREYKKKHKNKKK